MIAPSPASHLTKNRDGNAFRSQRRAVSSSSGKGWVVWGAAAIPNLLAVWFVAIQLRMALPDAVRRTVQAWLLLSGNTSQLPPIDEALPTLLELPLALLTPVRETGLSGPLITAVSGAVTTAVLNQILQGFQLASRWRYPMLALFALNPFVLFHFSNGSSAAVSVLFIVLAARFLLAWQRSNALQPVVLLGFAAGLAGLASYGAMLYAILLVAAIWLLASQQDAAQRGRTQALIIAYFTPTVFIIVAWALFAALITDEPFQFTRSAYDHASASGYRLADVAPTAHDYQPLAGQLWQLFPFFLLGVASLLGDYLLTRDRLSFCLVLLAISFPAFSAVLAWLAGQKPAPWSDYLVAIPFGFIMAGRIMARTANARSWLRWMIRCLVLAALGLSSVASGIAMAKDTSQGQWNYLFVKGLITQQPVDLWQEEREMARYLLQRATAHSVLIDDAEGYPIIFFTGHPELFVTPTDAGLPQGSPPRAWRIDYILLRAPQPDEALGSARYLPLPEGASVRLVTDWPTKGWRLYEVLGNEG